MGLMILPPSHSNGSNGGGSPIEMGRGETPVERSSKPPLDDFPLVSWGVEDK